MILATSAGREAIRDVFIFVEDSCDLTIDSAPAGNANPVTVNSAASIPVVVNRIVPVVSNPAVQSPSASNPPISNPVTAAAKASESKSGTRRGSDTSDPAASSIRVPAAKLDQFVNLVGELVTVQARWVEIAAHRDDPDVVTVSEEIERLTSALRENSISIPIDPRQLADVLKKWLKPSLKNSDIVSAGGQSPVTTEAAFDEKKMLARLMGDKELVGKILVAFLTDAPRQFRVLRDKLEKADAEGARLQAHTLKGAAATVSAKALLSLCQAIQREITASDLASALALLPRLEEEFQLLKRTLHQSGWV
jgi:chemotaxis protein histidine kinase CheA